MYSRLPHFLLGYYNFPQELLNLPYFKYTHFLASVKHKSIFKLLVDYIILKYFIFIKFILKNVFSR